MLGRRRLNWQSDGADWPHRDHSRFISAAGLTWHVQQMGRGPVMLLIHGTAASTHSWRGLMPNLAAQYRVLAIDLPGHGFTSMPPSNRLSLRGMTAALAGLLQKIGTAPAVVVGHSAGAPIAARLCLDGKIDPSLLISINGAWLPFPGSSGLLFPFLARALFINPLTPRVFAAFADKRAVTRLISQTGSHLDAEGIALYHRLLRNPVHVSGALGMMANWELEALNRALPALRQKVLLIVGENDLAIPPRSADKVRARIADADVQRLPGLGHLAHEEDPDLVSHWMLKAAGAIEPQPA